MTACRCTDAGYFENNALSVFAFSPAKPGAPPVFYKQKYVSGKSQKYRRVGANAVIKLTRVSGTFKVIK